MQTIRLPCDSGRRATSSAPQRAAPPDIPVRTPCLEATAWAVSIASSSVQAMISSTTERSKTGGTKPAPIPWIRWPTRNSASGFMSRITEQPIQPTFPDFYPNNQRALWKSQCITTYDT